MRQIKALIVKEAKRLRFAAASPKENHSRHTSYKSSLGLLVILITNRTVKNVMNKIRLNIFSPSAPAGGTARRMAGVHGGGLRPSSCPLPAKHLS